jgi:predicted ester cyclase
MSETDKAMIRRFYDDVFSDGTINIAAIDLHLADNFVVHDLPLGLKGREGYKKFISMLAVSFSEMTHIVAHDMFSNGDKVVARWACSGRHTAEFMGLRATNRLLTMKGIHIFRLTEENIAELWQEIDIMGILQQISAPALSGAAE